MTSIETLTGKSGNKYQYEVHPVNADWRPVPGNYAFSVKTPTLIGDIWRHLYIGETGDLKDRIPAHNRWAEARRLGAMFILAHVSSANIMVRKAEETDLIHAYNPPMNVQNKLAGLASVQASPGLGLGLFGLGQQARRGARLFDK